MNINNLWMIISIILVFIMIPGLAFFYGGFVRSQNSVSTILKSLIVFGPCALLWLIIGNSLVFGRDIYGFIGWENQRLFQDLVRLPAEQSLFSLYQLLFSLVAVAVITGAIVERVKFSFWLIFAPIWLLTVYFPVAHWVWHEQGWIAQLGGLDFAGGLVVHVSSGSSALIFAKLLGRRIDFFKLKKSYNLGLVILGTTFLWFGWFGFNAGSAFGLNQIALTALINTFISGSGAICSWMVMDYLFTPHRLYAKGVATAVICGLVAITPSAGYVNMWSACIIGAIISASCNIFMRYFHSVTKIDDSLDVFISHAVAGAFGALLTGVFVEQEIAGKLIENSMVVKANMVGVVSVGVYSMITTWIILKVLSKFTTMRVTEENEVEGLDVSLHGENIIVISKNG